MGFFDDALDFFGSAKEVVEQGADLYTQFAGTGTNPTAPTIVYSQAPPMSSKIPTWAILLVGAVVIYALAKGVRRG